MGSKMIFRTIKCAILAFYRKIVVTKRSVYLLYAVAFVMVGQGLGNFTVSVSLDPISCHLTAH